MLKRINLKPITKYFLKLCMVYAGIWTVVLGVVNCDNFLSTNMMGSLFPAMVTGIIFFPPIAIGLFYNRLFEASKWLICSAIALLAAIATIILFMIESGDEMAGLIFIILGMPSSTIITICTIIIASMMKQQQRTINRLGIASLYSVGISAVILILMALVENAEALFLLWSSVSMITIIVAACAVLLSAFTGLKTTMKKSQSNQ